MIIHQNAGILPPESKAKCHVFAMKSEGRMKQFQKSPPGAALKFQYSLPCILLFGSDVSGLCIFRATIHEPGIAWAGSDMLLFTHSGRRHSPYRCLKTCLMVAPIWACLEKPTILNYQFCLIYIFVFTIYYSISYYTPYHWFPIDKHYHKKQLEKKIRTCYLRPPKA